MKKIFKLGNENIKTFEKSLHHCSEVIILQYYNVKVYKCTVKQ